MSLSDNPTIVVVAYKRLHSLQRLLMSLIKGQYFQETRLIISIDFATERSNTDVKKYCSNFEWPFGEKILVEHNKNLGIIKHVFLCLDLSLDYGSVILLEDDDYISPIFYKYSCDVISFYKGDENIFGYSLIRHLKNGYLNTNFYPIQDDNDVYFAQIGFIHGFIICASEWLDFKKWYMKNENKSILKSDNLHQTLSHLDTQKGEWFQIFTKYLVKTRKFIAFPRTALNTNFHDPGEHSNNLSTWHQVPLTYNRNIFHFIELNKSLAVYDSFFEILPDRLRKLNCELQEYDFEVDLNVLKRKDQIKKAYLLSTRKPKRYEKTFGNVMKPLEQNIIENNIGKGIYLAKSEDFHFSCLQDLAIKKQNFYFYNQTLKKSLKMKYFIASLISKLKLI